MSKVGAGLARDGYSADTIAHKVNTPAKIATF